MKAPRALFARLVVAGALATCVGGANAQGIPVMDIDSIIQSILSVLQSLQQIENQIAQIRQYESQLRALSGMRNLGQVLNSPLLQNYVPANAMTIVSSIESGGYSGLSGTAKGLRDARMTYNCLDKEGDARTNCQSVLAQPYQQKAFMEDAMTAARGRISQIQSLMGQIDATVDPKGVAEIQARIEAENALIQHEQTQITMAKGVADAEERIQQSRNKEQQMEQATRSGRLSDYAR
jgi:type IV secretion system protein VirB5